MHILSAEQFDLGQIEKIFKRADYFKKQTSIAARRTLADKHKGRQICTVFFQPSTRTRLSFETAAAKLGIGVISTENARENSSAAKSETLEDTIRILNGYGYDAIVMRHYESGAAARAAALSSVPVINAGDGRTGEHPTQALLDTYTIYQHHGRLNNLRIVCGGDLRQGRTVRSLCFLLSKYKNNHVTFVSVPALRVGDDVKNALRKSKTEFQEITDVKKAFKDADVVYWTRLQTEYLDKPNAIKNGFKLNLKTIKNLPKKAIIMHPLPRVGEIDPEIDDDPRAIYFRQASNGLYVRMALFDLLLTNKL